MGSNPTPRTTSISSRFPFEIETRVNISQDISYLSTQVNQVYNKYLLIRFRKHTYFGKSTNYLIALLKILFTFTLVTIALSNIALFHGFKKLTENPKKRPH